MKLLIPDLPEPQAYLDSLVSMHDSRIYSNKGPLLQRFEERISEYFSLRASECHGVSNATIGILGLIMTSEADVICLPAYSFAATFHAASISGKDLCWHDVDERGVMLAACPTDERMKRRVALVVAPFGMTLSELSPTLSCLRQSGHELILDAAASLASSLQLSEAIQYPTVFSLHATKPLGIGEGGLVIIPADDNRNHLFGAWANFGFQGERKPKTLGLNAKMSELHAAIGNAVLDHLKSLLGNLISYNQRRISSLERSGMDSKSPVNASLTTPYNLYRLDSNIDLQSVAVALREEGIPSVQWWQNPSSQLLDVTEIPPTSVELQRATLGLPNHFLMENDDYDFLFLKLKSVLLNSSPER